MTVATLDATVSPAHDIAVLHRPAAGELQVQLLEPADERWLSFASSQPSATIFHHPAWSRNLADVYGCRPFVVTACDARGKIAAGLPMMDIRSLLTGRRWDSLPYTDYCPPLYADQKALAALTEGLVDLFHEKRIPLLELRGDCAEHPMLKPAAQYALHILPLEADSARVAAHFERVHKQNIQTAEKNQLSIRRGSDVPAMREFYMLQVETRRRHGVPVQPWRYFERLATSLMAQGLGSLLLAYKDDQCLAGLLLLHWRQTVVCKYAASREDSLPLRPNNLLFWHAIRWGCDNGYRAFDMGRTDLENTGLRRFKCGWGAPETMLTYHVLSRAPLPAVSKPSVPAFVQNVIRRSPPSVCRILGELLYKHYG